MNKYMKMAIEEAKKGISTGDGGPFGAVIVKDDVVIAKAHNNVVKKNDPTCHGEMEAIREASKNLKSFDLSGCDIYTTGEPCPMCLGAIMWANIKHVYYGCNIKDTDDIGFRDLKFYSMTKEDKDRYISMMDREECLDLYKDYKMIVDKKNY